MVNLLYRTELCQEYIRVSIQLLFSFLLCVQQIHNECAVTHTPNYNTCTCTWPWSILCQAYYVASTSSSESEIQWILKQQVEPQCCHHHYMSAACIGTTALLLSALLLYLIALLAMVSQVHHYHVMLHAHPPLRCWQQTSLLTGTVYGRSSNTMLSILSSTLPSSPPTSSILIPLIGF